MTILDEVRRYWDEDAETYDASPGHRPTSPAVMAAWTASLQRLLPPSPARILDAGAGTGFLSLIAARLGHRVTALDLSGGMLEVLRRSAEREGLEVDVLASPADQPPDASFDAIIERHLIWTLENPSEALAAWRRAAPNGVLVLFESVWGQADPLASARRSLLRLLRRLRGAPPEHHAEYSPDVLAALPLGDGTPPSRLVELVQSAGWPSPRLERLRDVEWAERSSLPFPERLIGPSARFAVVAGRSALA